MLIIGNEILNGSVVDTNTPWLAKLLYRYPSSPQAEGWHNAVREVVMCPAWPGYLGERCLTSPFVLHCCSEMPRSLPNV